MASVAESESTFPGTAECSGFGSKQPEVLCLGDGVAGPGGGAAVPGTEVR